MSESIQYELHELDMLKVDVADELLAGLQQTQKSIAPKYFYDERGSELFTEITGTQEYYVTRTEIALLKQYGAEMAACIGPDSLLVEYGSGSSEKIRILLDQVKPKIYAPLDISRDYLDSAAVGVATEYPWLEVKAACLDYTQPFSLPFALLDNCAGFFPGSSIGNFTPDSAIEFLSRVRNQLQDKGGLLLGVDLKKDDVVLNAAYNDTAGITAAFNLNVLSHINNLIGSNFDTSQFVHFAQYNDKLGCIQMFLESLSNQRVEVLGKTIEFSKGEMIHTEDSFKYSVSEVELMARSAGFNEIKSWTDEKGWFGIFYLF
jgi:dimethylhistidine N-methyltransferase